MPETVTNMTKTLLNILIPRPIHNVGEPILVTVLERQPKQQLGLSPFFQPWQKKLRKSGNDYVQSQPHVNQKRVPKLFQPNPVFVEMVDPNRTRPKCIGKVRTNTRVINKGTFQTELPDHVNENDRLLTDRSEISNKFNEYFINIGPKLADKIQGNKVNFTTFLGKRSVNSIFSDAVTEKEVENEINNLNGNKSCGHDEISPNLVKKISTFTVKPLTHIYNQSLLTGEIPNDLKIALVTPVFKANNKEEFSNYRPISVLPCFSKILEKIMYKRILKYLDKHNMLFQSQYGFRKKHSTNLAT